MPNLVELGKLIACMALMVFIMWGINAPKRRRSA
jgi:hypothetical protein